MLAILGFFVGWWLLGGPLGAFVGVVVGALMDA